MFVNGPSARNVGGQRILIAGVTGSGKTTLAQGISAATGIPHHELDALHHGPNWTPNPRFGDEVAAIAAQDQWVCEFAYRQFTNTTLLPRAQMIVWLDYSIPLALYRVAKRTISRSVHRTELWNGNVEPPLRAVFTEEDHILRWAWRTRNKWRERMPELVAEYPDLPVVRLKSPTETRAWLAQLG